LPCTAAAKELKICALDLKHALVPGFRTPVVAVVYGLSLAEGIYVNH
jgi:hypothetical protein